MRAAIDSLDFGTVFRFWQDGTHEVMQDSGPEVYSVGEAPLDIQPANDGWFTVTDNMSGQYGYNGPVMHDSEFITDGMVEDILFRHDHREHYFCVQYVSYDDGNEYNPEGWVILARKVIL